MKSRKRIRIHAVLALVALAMPIAAQEVTLTNTNPVPLINQPLVPDAVAPGGSEFQLTVNGTGFVSGSLVNLNGSALTTTFVNDAQLTATVPASDIRNANTASVTVFNPSPGGGTSNVAFFPIKLPNSFVSLSESSLAIPAGPWGLAVGDFNGDGKQDLAVPNESLNVVYITLGNGDGTFQSPLPYATGNAPQFVATGDFNSDGKLDIVVCNRTDGTISILLGKGDGTFQAHVDYRAGSTADVVAVADLNGDGKLDVVVTNFAASTVSVLLGNGDGTFQGPVAFPTGSNPNWTVIGDFNRDGVLDLAVTNSADNTVSILLGNGDGTFQAHVDYPAGQGPACVVAGDLNGDGKLDLAVADNITTGQVYVLLSNGDGTFQQGVTYPAGDGAINLAAADFNGDGKLDLAVVNSVANSVSILLGDGDGTFGQQKQFPTGTQPRQVAIGDFNGDGQLDLAVAHIGGSQGTSVLLQDETIRVLPPSLNFGEQLVGSKSSQQKAVLTNIGSKTLSISSITIAGADSGDFSKTDNCGSSLPPKAHCTINVTFKPTVLGPRMANVKITDNAPGSPQHVPLSGAGVTSGPNATLSRKNLNFPLQLVGTTSPAQPVKLSNFGTEALNITSIVASGDFSQKNDCGSNLPPLGTCTINVIFVPTRRGHRTGTLTITDNAPDSPQKVNLTGAATVVQLNPTSLNFGDVIVGFQSPPQNTTLTNVGRAKLHITNIAITGTDSGDFFIQQNTCPNPGYLGGGKSCTITLVFKPTQVGSHSADVSISDDGGGSPQQVSLSGTGETQCSGACGFVCALRHCACRGGTCVAASGTETKEIASRQTCGQTNPFTQLR
jgi:hypothetical protein